MANEIIGKTKIVVKRARKKPGKIPNPWAAGTPGGKLYRQQRVRDAAVIGAAGLAGYGVYRAARRKKRT